MEVQLVGGKEIWKFSQRNQPNDTMSTTNPIRNIRLSTRAAYFETIVKSPGASATHIS
jgi:hypothetical protein